MNLNWLKKMGGLSLQENVYSGSRDVDYTVLHDTPDLQAYKVITPKGLLLFGSEKWHLWQEAKQVMNGNVSDIDFSEDTLQQCGIVITRTGWNKAPKKYLIAPLVARDKGWDENNHEVNMAAIVSEPVWQQLRSNFHHY